MKLPHIHNLRENNLLYLVVCLNSDDKIVLL